MVVYLSRNIRILIFLDIFKNEGIFLGYLEDLFGTGLSQIEGPFRLYRVKIHECCIFSSK